MQRVFYSRYLQAHGLKAQIVYFLNGIIGSAFIAKQRQNDNGTQILSGLNDYLLVLLAGCLIGGLFPALYCDGIFAVLNCILPRFRNPSEVLKLLNMCLASLRVCIEHVLGDHTNRFKIFVSSRYLSLINDGAKVRRMCLGSFFVLNCYSCINGSRSQFFGELPPTLEEYLPLDEVFESPPAINLGTVWDYGHA